MKLSIIDIGTQSVKHYIFSQDADGRKLTHYKRYSEANLGEHETISQKTIDRNIEILKNCFELNTKENVEKTHMVGTEILRKASNAKDFTDGVSRISGMGIEIISQDKEALYLYEGFLEVVSPGEKFGVINIGGGSTELVIGTKEKLLKSMKFPFGVKFIRKTFGEHNDIDWDELDQYLEKEINPSAQTSKLFITGVLDFITTIDPYVSFNATHSQLLDHPIVLTMQDWRQWILKLRTTPIEKHRSQCVLHGCQEAGCRKSVSQSPRSNRWNYLRNE
jgi:exopolyphosphatase / guanosine-5'-triphosphate,3'-diphosphate pyrophosphatase